NVNSEDMLDLDIVRSLKEMLDEHNSIAQSFRYARDRYREDDFSGVKLRLIRKRGSDGRVYNLPSASEVAALIVGDIDNALGDRDIVVETQDRVLQRIDVKHPLYLGLQYPLLFPYGEDGYRDDVERSYISRGRTNPRSTSHLREELYKNLKNAFDRGEDEAINTGKRIVIPSSFTGVPRYVAENCKDGFAFCRWAGYPHLFITITCNPKWPEIIRFLKASNLNAEDRLDILCRVFKFKLDQLLHDLKNGHFLGTVNARVYTVEFQKRGLPHAHILLFLHPSAKPNTGLDIDNLISAEIPNKDSNLSLFAAVTSYMMHGFPHYKRRNNGSVVKKSGVELDNRYVVPYNAKLLLKYQAHINVEYTCQSNAIKYLFKYIHKGQDRVTTAINHSDDEIKMFYDCRYVSACEAAWRIFGFEIHYRFPLFRDCRFTYPMKRPLFLVIMLQYVMSRLWQKLDNQFLSLGWMQIKNIQKDACYSLGLLDDDNEYIDAIKEAGSWGSAAYLRNMFALLLFSNSMNRPENVFQKCWELLSDDILYRHRQIIGNEDAFLTEDSIKNITLAEIDKVLQSNGKCLSDYPSMPSIVGESLLDMQNRLVMDELLQKRFFFLYGFGGTGKTFIWNTLSAFVRSSAGIVLNVASSGIASLLLPGGRTTHSSFRIPIQITEESMCNINQKSTLAELLSKTKLIIWDEAPMVHKFCFEALDRTLKDALRSYDTSCVDMPFGGKVVVLGGDFRQILPVIPHGSRQEIVHATINSSYLWSHCQQDENSSLEDDEISPKILNTFSCSGIPDHKLILKVKVLVMLLRNIDQSRGLCNGTRLLITKLGNHVVEAIVLTGNNIGDTVLIPRMTMSPSSHTFPVNFQRRQFPLVVSFAMTINKSQGHSLSHVGIYLPRPIFTHGILYLALSKVKSRHGLKMLILDEDGCVTNTTFNIVYKEVFQRLL
ncbi:uncharacterized protein LOC133292063, partial [Gastrolobium bilobum]|uniref:uncharacterized protein LOC133292063 n=1 Tax=Gastrolobium bilobum TaxID=150636 RepID=UPI002AB1822B